ncbi:MAG: hypothetical protein NVSMB54_37110 [Ktedonobacteraceae bacterium]
MSVFTTEKDRRRSHKMIVFSVTTTLVVIILLLTGLLSYNQRSSSYSQQNSSSKGHDSIQPRSTQNINYVRDPFVTTASATNPNTPANWNTNSWGTNTAIFTYLHTGHSHNRSVQVQVTSYSSGDAKWRFTPLALRPQEEYQFTDYYQSNVMSRVVAFYTDGYGKTSADELRHAPASPTRWTQYKDSFVVPSNTKSVSVFHLLSSIGTLTTDDFSVTPYTPVGFNRPLVTLTFDNGFEVNINTVLPKLTGYGFTSTQYISPAYLTTDQQKNPKGPNYNGYIQAFYNSGNEIASHTWDHTDLTTLTSAQVTTQLMRSQQYLEHIVGAGNVSDFALPFGAYNQQVLDEVHTDYQSDRTVDPGYNSKDNFDRYRLRVQNMLPTTTLAEFQGWLGRAKHDHTWLILVYHRVVSNPGQYDTATPDFGQQMQALKSSGITVLTIKGGLCEVRPQLR